MPGMIHGESRSGRIHDDLVLVMMTALVVPFFGSSPLETGDSVLGILC